MTSFRLQDRVGGYASPVTKNRKMFVDPHADGRSAWARRWRDLVLLHASDLGGYQTLSAAQLSVCKRCATLEVELENWEGRKSASLPVDIELYARVSGRLARLFELIGVRRVSKPTDPLSEFARAFEGHAAAAVVDDDDGDGDEDQELPIEKGLDREPGEA